MTDAKTATTCKVGRGRAIHAIGMRDRRPKTFPFCGQPRRFSRPHSIGVKGLATSETVTCKKCLAVMKGLAWLG